MVNKNRKIEFDLMRIIACLGVIMIHADVFNQLDSYSTNSLSYQGINIWGTLSRWAVPAFVMLSGMFVIPKSGKESLKQLFVKRVIRMVVAYIVWSAVYSFYNVFFLNKVYSGTKIKTFLDGCFSGETHMWYLLMLAGLYIISPLLNDFILDRCNVCIYFNNTFYWKSKHKIHFNYYKLNDWVYGFTIFVWLDIIFCTWLCI